MLARKRSKREFNFHAIDVTVQLLNSLWRLVFFISTQGSSQAKSRESAYDYTKIIEEPLYFQTTIMIKKNETNGKFCGKVAVKSGGKFVGVMFRWLKYFVG